MRKNWTKAVACMLGLSMALGVATSAFAEDENTDAVLEVEADAELEAEVGVGTASGYATKDLALGTTVKGVFTKDVGNIGSTYGINYLMPKGTDTGADISVKVTKWGKGENPTLNVTLSKVAVDADTAQKLKEQTISSTSENHEVVWDNENLSAFTMELWGKKFDGQYGITVETESLDTEFEITVKPKGYKIITENGVVRYAGNVALDTMQAIVDNGGVFAQSENVIIATIDGYWDALAASSLAGTLEAPVLITDGNALSAQTKAEIERLGAKNAIIVGGTNAVSDNVQKEIEKLGVKTDRAAGQLAVDTAVEIYKKGKDQWGDTAIIATSNGYWDALAIAPYAWSIKAPIFLTGTEKATGDQQVLPSSALDALLADGRFKQIIIVGGPAAVSEHCEKEQLVKGYCKKYDLPDTAVVRLAGKIAIETSAEIAKFEAEAMGGEDFRMTVATSDGYWDALTAAPVVGKQGKNLLVLVDKDGANTTAIDAALKLGNVGRVQVLGGEAALSSKVWDYLVENAGHDERQM